MTESTGRRGRQVMWGVALLAPIGAATVLAGIELLNAWGATSWSPLGSLATSAVVVLALAYTWLVQHYYVKWRARERQGVSQ